MLWGKKQFKGLKKELKSLKNNKINVNLKKSFNILFFSEIVQK